MTSTPTPTATTAANKRPTASTGIQPATAKKASKETGRHEARFFLLGTMYILLLGLPFEHVCVSVHDLFFTAQFIPEVTAGSKRPSQPPPPAQKKMKEGVYAVQFYLQLCSEIRFF